MLQSWRQYNVIYIRSCCSIWRKNKSCSVVTPAPVAKPVAPVEVDKDSDSDGVLDKLDKCPGTPKGAKVDTVGCITLINLNVNFDTDKSEIKDIYSTRIHEFAKL